MLTKIIEIDLQQPVECIYVDSRYGKLLALVRWGYQPLALLQLLCGTGQRTIGINKLRHEIMKLCSWQLWEEFSTGSLGEQANWDASLLPPISIVVCTRDRLYSLEHCLQKLRQLDYPLYEVVVVDNCSQDTRVKQVVVESGFRYVREDNPGLDWARNRGIRESLYEIIAFIDDDALATPGWLRGIASGFADSEVMAVTGLVLPNEIESQAQSDFEAYGGMSKGFTSFTIRRHELNGRKLFWASSWGVGANMAFRRTLFQAIGTFDVALDVGTPTKGGGDIEFFYRTVVAGYTLRYEPAAFVYHTHRRMTSALNQQIYNNGRGFGSYLLTIMRNEPQHRTQILWFALRWWVWPWFIYRLGRSILTGDRWTRHFAFLELRGALSALHAYGAAQALAKRSTQPAAS
jgi:glycosyltransferase involved in cell wall biosynthesis